jgi:hypothetical protein
MRGALAAMLLLAAVASAAAVERLHGRGVYYVTGHVRAPLAGVGTRDAHASNRIALDDDASEVTIDRTTQRIVFRNAARYAARTIVGDVLLLGVGVTEREGRVPFGVHLKIEKQGDRFRTSVHPHPTTRARVLEPEVEPFEVLVSDGRTETRVLGPEQARKAIREPELAARVANLLLQVEDHTAGKAIVAGAAGSRLVDLTIGYGAPGVNLKLARVQVLSLDPANAPLVERGALAEMLAHGSWELRLSPTAVTLPKSEFDRDLFLFGLDDVAVLAPLKSRGLRRGETLVVGYRDGKGFVALGDRRAEIVRPDDVARAYLEYHLLGGVIARQIATLPERIARVSRPARE